MDTLIVLYVSYESHHRVSSDHEKPLMLRRTVSNLFTETLCATAFITISFYHAYVFAVGPSANSREALDKLIFKGTTNGTCNLKE